MKNILLLLLLFSVVDIAFAAPINADAAKPTEAAKVPHGGMTTKPGLAPGHPDSLPADTRLINSGKVLEVLDSDMYTYVQVTGKNGPLWLAGYKTEISKGATVRYSGGIGMPNFFSKALNRTFDLIVFVDSLVLVKK